MVEYNVAQLTRHEPISWFPAKSAAPPVALLYTSASLIWHCESSVVINRHEKVAYDDINCYYFIVHESLLLIVG